MKTGLKRIWPIIAILTLYAVVFNAISFICAVELTNNFWCGYAFIMLSWLCAVIVAIHTALYSGRNCVENALFIKAPSILISVIYLLAQTAFGIAVMVITSFSIKAAICIQIALFALYLCIVIALVMYEKKVRGNS